MKFAFVALSTGFLAFVADAVEASNSHVCTDTSNTNNVDDSCHYAEQDDDDVLTAQLIDWLRDNGAYINEKLAIKQLDPSLPRGLYAMEDMEAGETVCKIPWALILKPTAEELANGSVREELSDCGTIEAVFHAITVDEDNMTPYGRYLLNRPKAYTAPFWSQVSYEQFCLADDAREIYTDCRPSPSPDRLRKIFCKICWNPRKSNKWQSLMRYHVRDFDDNIVSY